MSDIAEQNMSAENTGMFGVSGTGDTSGYGGLQKRKVQVGSTERPFGGYFDEVVDALERAYPGFNDGIEKVVVDRGELTLHVRREKLVEVAQVLRDDLKFEMCLGVSGAHYPDESGRELRALYPLLSLTRNQRVRIEVAAPDNDPHIPSVVEVWAGNNWHERETYDMFGIVFDGHPALTRIFMPDDWNGHPQRKDYPLGGIPVEYKGATVPPPSDRRVYR
jgi:NADH-quinone oxidoreductase subunit C